MPLITCPDCTSEISDQARSCPKCGYPFETIPLPKAAPPTTSNLGRVFCLFVGLFFLLAGLAGANMFVGGDMIAVGAILLLAALVSK